MGSALAKEFRSPTPGSCMGWMAQKAMSMGKGADSVDAVAQILQPAASSNSNKPVIVEIGPGSGYALRELFKTYEPSRVYGVEISQAFRDSLAADAEFSAFIDSGVLSLHENDAKELQFIPDDSVDIIFAFNVIYFLDPLSTYLHEMRRVLKAGGTVNLGVKKIAQDMDPSVYINTDWDKCLQDLKAAGFVDVQAKEERLEGPLAYTQLVARKPA